MLVAKFEDGFPVPVLDDAPILPDHLAWAYSMFKELRTCRPVGMNGPSSIPVTAMREHFDAADLSPHQWHNAKWYWMSLDAEELSFYSKKQAALMPKMPKIPEATGK